MSADKEKQLDMYEMMFRIRSFEMKARELFLNGQLPGFLHLYPGEEAIATGVCANLTPKDQICSTHRGHGHCIAKGGETKRMMAELYAKTTGYCHGKGGSMHIADPDLGILGANGIVGAGMPIAVGAAYAMKFRKTNDVTVVFFGDGASNRGTFHEALNMASLYNLPVIFVCENNDVGMYTRQKYHQKIKDVSKRAVGYDIEGFTYDGNDVLEVYTAAKTAIDKARSGGGPTLLEFKTWRQLGHTLGDKEEYRTAEEKEAWLKKDPIPRFEEVLLKKKIVTEQDLEAIRAKVTLEIDEAVQFGIDSPHPDLIELTVGVFAD